VVNLFAANAIRVMKLAKKPDGGLCADGSIDFKQVYNFLWYLKQQ
jgi:hypothetical protein